MSETHSGKRNGATEAVRRLGVRYPIIQGPFGGGLSTTRLAATVSNLGGLGSYGAYSLSPDEIFQVTRELRSLTPHPFALNLWVSDHDPGGLELSPEAFERAYALFEPYYRELGVEKPEPPQRYAQKFEEQVDALLEARPPVFSFVFGVPSATLLAACRERGIVTVGAATSIAEAQALDDAGVDLIVATGFEAGGHRPSFLARAEDSLMGTLALTPLVADRVKAPVISAGGIGDGRGVRAVLTLGAQAAQLGTAFLACEESGASPEHRAALCSWRRPGERSHGAQVARIERETSGRLTAPCDCNEAGISAFSMHPDFPGAFGQGFSNHAKALSTSAHRADLRDCTGTPGLWRGPSTRTGRGAARGERRRGLPGAAHRPGRGRGHPGGAAVHPRPHGGAGGHDAHPRHALLRAHL
jgi:nitronate monooxygenase